MGVDAALLAIRCYCERAAKELHAAGGRILPKDGRAPPSLQQQLETLQAWHAFLATRLQAFKVPACPSAVPFNPAPADFCLRSVHCSLKGPCSRVLVKPTTL